MIDPHFHLHFHFEKKHVEQATLTPKPPELPVPGDLSPILPMVLGCCVAGAVTAAFAFIVHRISGGGSSQEERPPSRQPDASPINTERRWTAYSTPQPNSGRRWMHS
jgi:hypothetical protein